jgi:hypothetical protein
MPKLQTKQVSTPHINKTKLEGAVFANQFQLLNPEMSYTLIKNLIEKDESSTSLGNGCTEFPIDCPRLILFQNLLRLCEERNDLGIRRIIVQETGITKKSLTMRDYGQSDNETFRVLINLRPPPPENGQDAEKNKTVGVHFNIKGIVACITPRRPFGVILPGELTNISIFSGKVIPGTRQDNARSIFVVLDVCPLGATRANVADRLCAQNPIDPKTFERGMEKALSSLNLPKPEPSEETEPSGEIAIDASTKAHPLVQPVSEEGITISPITEMDSSEETAAGTGSSEEVSPGVESSTEENTQ